MKKLVLSLLALVVLFFGSVSVAQDLNKEVEKVLRSIYLLEEYSRDAKNRTTITETEKDGVLTIATPDWGKAEELIFDARIKGKKVNLKVLPYWKPSIKDTMAGHEPRFAANKTVVEAYRDAEYHLLKDKDLATKANRDPVEWKQNLDIYEKHLGLDKCRGKASIVERARRVAWTVAICKEDGHHTTIVGLQFTD